MKFGIYCCYILVKAHQCSISIHFGPLWPGWFSFVQFGPIGHFGPIGPFLWSIWCISIHLVHFDDTLEGEVYVERGATLLTIMLHSQRNVSRFLIKLHFSYVIEILIFFFLIQVLYLFIFASSLGHSRYIKDEPFVRSVRNIFQPHIALFKYLALYNN